MKRLLISAIILIDVMQTCGAKPIKDDKIKHAIEAVARASIAELYCKGAQFDHEEGEKILADAISSYGEKTVSELESAFDKQYSRDALDNSVLWCAETRNFVKKSQERIPLSFKDVDEEQ
jgi:hypothetical protein